jgi:hypothetical protein
MTRCNDPLSALRSRAVLGGRAIATGPTHTVGDGGVAIVRSGASGARNLAFGNAGGLVAPISSGLASAARGCADPTGTDGRSEAWPSRRVSRRPNP